MASAAEYIPADAAALDACATLIILSENTGTPRRTIRQAAQSAHAEAMVRNPGNSPSQARSLSETLRTLAQMARIGG